MVSTIWCPPPYWRRVRAAPRSLGGVSTGTPYSWRQCVCHSVPRKPWSASSEPELGLPAPRWGPAGPSGPIYGVPLGRVGGGVPAQQRIGQPPILSTGRGEHEARRPTRRSHRPEQLTAAVPVLVTASPPKSLYVPKQPPPAPSPAPPQQHCHGVDPFIGRRGRPQLLRHHRYPGHQPPAKSRPRRLDALWLNTQGKDPRQDVQAERINAHSERPCHCAPRASVNTSLSETVSGDPGRTGFTGAACCWDGSSTMG